MWTNQEIVELIDGYKAKLKKIEEEIKERYGFVSRVNINLLKENNSPIDVLKRLNMDPELRLAHIKAEHDELKKEYENRKEHNQELKELIKEAEKKIIELNRENIFKKQTLATCNDYDIIKEKSRLVRLRLKEKNLRTKLDELLECPFYKESQDLKQKMNAIKSKETDLEDVKRDVETVQLLKEAKEKEIEELNKQNKRADEDLMETKKKLIE